MNLVGHARYLGENDQELRLLFKLIAWLTEGKDGAALSPPEIERVYPDQVIFSLDVPAEEAPWLYWREAYHPNWHAYLGEGNQHRELPIYRAGPGFMLIPVHTNYNDVSVTLTWEPSLIENIAGIFSLFGVLLVIGIFFDGMLLGGNGFTWIKIAMTMWLPKPFLDEEVHAEKNNHRLQSVIDYNSRQQEPVSAASELSASAEVSGVDERLKSRHKDLLRSWMASTGHNDDDWVNKILEKRNR
jgi:hypothetical protein